MEETFNRVSNLATYINRVGGYSEDIKQGGELINLITLPRLKKKSLKDTEIKNLLMIKYIICLKTTFAKILR